MTSILIKGVIFCCFEVVESLVVQSLEVGVNLGLFAYKCENEVGERLYMSGVERVRFKL